MPPRAARVSLQPHNLDPRTVREMADSASDRAEGLARRLEAARVSLMEALREHRGTDAVELRADLERIRLRYNTAREAGASLEADYQESLLYHRQTLKLGSRGRVDFKEAVVLGLIFVVLSLLAVEMFGNIGPDLRRTFFLVDTACCVVFLLDLAFELSLADDKRWFLRSRWLDIVTSIPLPLEPVGILRGGRLLRMVRLIRVLRAFRILLIFWRGLEHLSEVLDVKVMRRSLALTLLLIGAGAVLIHVAEGGPEARDAAGVETLFEAVWWSFTTTVTGGYGDVHNPVTVGGRAITVLLVIAGMVIVGVFTATLTSVLVREEQQATEGQLQDLSLAVEQQTALVRKLAERLEQVERESPPGD